MQMGQASDEGVEQAARREGLSLGTLTTLQRFDPGAAEWLDQQRRTRPSRETYRPRRGRPRDRRPSRRTRLRTACRDIDRQRYELVFLLLARRRSDHSCFNTDSIIGQDISRNIRCGFVYVPLEVS